MLLKMDHQNSVFLFVWQYFYHNADIADKAMITVRLMC